MDYAALLGHFHPLVVHLPIGFLCAGALVALVSRRERYAPLRPAIPFLLFWGALGGGVSCVLGYCLSLQGDYDPVLLSKHQWTGIACTVSAALGYLGYRFWGKISGWGKGTIWVLIGGLLLAAGHYGGSLTHGASYLTEAWREKRPPTLHNEASLSDTMPKAPKTPVATTKAGTPKPVLSPKPAITYGDLVAPILKDKCYRCHNAGKQKGGLRLDTPAELLKGGKHGPVLQPGEPDKSPLFVNCARPLDDEDHMPPKGKPQLTLAELAILKHWIQKGAAFGNVAAVSVEPAATLSIKEETSLSTRGETTPLGAEAALPEKKVAPAPASVLQKLAALQIIVSSLGESSEYCSVNFVNVKTYQPAMIDALLPLQAQILHLRLSNQPVTDQDMAKIAKLKSITHLNLEKSQLTDVGLASMKALPNLSQLNLYGVRVTDKGLKTLTNCKNLKTLYLWDTQTTPKGVAILKKALPNLEIVAGAPHFAMPDTTTSKREAAH